MIIICADNLLLAVQLSEHSALLAGLVTFLSNSLSFRLPLSLSLAVVSEDKQALSRLNWGVERRGEKRRKNQSERGGEERRGEEPHTHISHTKIHHTHAHHKPRKYHASTWTHTTTPPPLHPPHFTPPHHHPYTYLTSHHHTTTLTPTHFTPPHHRTAQQAPPASLAALYRNRPILYHKFLDKKVNG